jgi:hypothetical protein
MTSILIQAFTGFGKSLQGGKQYLRGLKPDVFSIAYGTTEEAAENFCF